MELIKIYDDRQNEKRMEAWEQMDTDPLLFLRVFLRTRKNGIWLPRSFNHYQEKYLKSCLKPTEVRPKPARQCGASFLCVAEAIWRAIRRGQAVYLKIIGKSAMISIQHLIDELIQSNKLMSCMFYDFTIISQGTIATYVFWTGGRITVGMPGINCYEANIGALYDAYICDSTSGTNSFPTFWGLKRCASSYPRYNSNVFDERIWLTLNEYRPTVTDKLFDCLFNEFEQALAQDENYRKAILSSKPLNVRRSA